MKQELKIGVVCIARKTFDFEAADEIYKKIDKYSDLGKYKESNHYKKRQNLKLIRKKMGEWGRTI